MTQAVNGEGEQSEGADEEAEEEMSPAAALREARRNIELAMLPTGEGERLRDRSRHPGNPYGKGDFVPKKHA